MHRQKGHCNICLCSLFICSSEKLEVIDGQLNLDFIFNEAEALTETLYVIEPAQEDVLPPKKKKRAGKREKDLEGLPVVEIPHVLSEEKLTEIFGANGWKRLPDEVYKRVKIEPAVYTVEEHHVQFMPARTTRQL